jgi:Beta-glucosidase-related glycosidases
MKTRTLAAAVTAIAVAAVTSISCTSGEPASQDDGCTATVDSLLSQMTIEEKVHMLIGERSGNYKGVAGKTFPVERLGIPSIWLADGPAGLRFSPKREGSDRTYYCTQFPIGTALAATWDTSMVKKVTGAMGNEVLEYGVDVLLAPGINIHRNPLCGRNFEYFSEDPVLSGNIAAAYIEGVQSNGVGTSVKHFAVNNSEINRCASDSRVSVRALREIYLRNFEIAVRKGRPWTVMSSYNRVNGVYTAERSDLLLDVLREDWGYKGSVMTDWGDAADPIKQITGGNDMLQPGSKWQYDSLMVAYKNGDLTEEVIDARVRNLLTLVVKSPTYKGYEASEAPDLASHAKISREAAGDAMVLLKNDDKALPLAEGDTIALFGANSYDLSAGGYGSGDVNCERIVNLDEGLVQAGFELEKGVETAYRVHNGFEKARLAPINAAKGWFMINDSYDEMSPLTTTVAAARAAKIANVAVITVKRESGEGYDRMVDDDFNLKESEIELIKKVSALFHAEGKKVIVVLNVCGAMETASWKDLPDAILVSWLPGQEAGAAIADVISGKVTPSGCLPMSFPMAYADVPSQNFPILDEKSGKNDSFMRYERGKVLHEVENIDYQNYTEDLYVGYRYYTSKAVPVSYPFGFGLSYTKFELTNLNVKKVSDGFNVSVRVTNIGGCEGRKVVQLYVENIADDEPVRQLKAFAKTKTIIPGGAEVVTMHVTYEDLAVFDEAASEWVVAPKGYTFVVAEDAASAPVLKVTSKSVREKRIPVTRSLEAKPLFIE